MKKRENCGLCWNTLGIDLLKYYLGVLMSAGAILLTHLSGNFSAKSDLTEVAPIFGSKECIIYNIYNNWFSPKMLLELISVLSSLVI